MEKDKLNRSKEDLDYILLALAFAGPSTDNSTAPNSSDIDTSDSSSCDVSDSGSIFDIDFFDDF